MDIRRLTILSSAGALLLLALAAVPFASPTHAQNPPATFYGSQTPAEKHAGHVFEAFVDGVSCGKAVVDATGFWILPIAEDAPCSPTDGDTVSFTHNGDALAATETWRPGGAPADVANGVPDALAAPTAPSTGNAGLASATAGDTAGAWIILLSGLTIAFVFGARRAVNSRR